MSKPIIVGPQASQRPQKAKWEEMEWSKGLGGGAAHPFVLITGVLERMLVWR